MSEFNHRHVFDMVRQRHRQLLSVAAGKRLIRQASTSRSRSQCFYDRTLARLGHHMVRWGWRLQQRHGSPTPGFTV